MAPLTSSDVDLLRTAEAEELFGLADALSARVNIYRNAFQELIADMRLKFDATPKSSRSRTPFGRIRTILATPMDRGQRVVHKPNVSLPTDGAEDKDRHGPEH